MPRDARINENRKFRDPIDIQRDPWKIEILTKMARIRQRLSENSEMFKGAHSKVTILTKMAKKAKMVNLSKINP